MGRVAAGVTPDYWDEACRHLVKRDRVMKKLIPRLGEGRLQAKGDAFTTLARSIVGQQVSVKSAQAAWTKVTALLGGPATRIQPAAVLGQPVEQLRAAGLPHTRCEAGQRWVWDGVGFEVLHPRAADYVPGAADNSLSCVLQVTSAGPGGARVALLTADITAREEARLLRDLPALRADLLLAPHHGSLTSSSAAWLAALKPRQIVIQSGHLNRYHHPAPEILQRYRELGLPWVASPACGAARWRSQEPQRVDCQREQRRYWQDGRLPQRLSAARGPELPTASLAARRQ